MAIDVSIRAGHAAWYQTTLATFLTASDAAILGALTAASRFDVQVAQREAWLDEISLLRAALSEAKFADADGWVALEFDVPRLATRIDAVVIVGAAVIPVEFKIGATEFLRGDREQAWDYGLD